MKLPFILSMLLPRRRTTEDDARQAMMACDINPDEIVWEVGADGSFAIGRKHPDADNLTDARISCLVGWAQRNRIKLGFVGWESRPN
ncbi:MULTISPECIES: hypothetical protein [unclassified Sphingomonas]|uniref:hypothetical protein n=1 Tax=unclassified Sphingomonas TaxID=196159 RepID=UPI002150EEC1|nr:MULTISPECIES: hypothetical protein [unclassified Sphingomonas]MCR5871400.1 hypothetical protein [Sphingomonas sp. J344]UUY00303.1 hypothetical protein LRS08_04085 [Sphingomonas sp. J315]